MQFKEQKTFIYEKKSLSLFSVPVHKPSKELHSWGRA